MRKGRGRLPLEGAEKGKKAVGKISKTHLDVATPLVAAQNVIPVVADSLIVGTRLIETGRGVRVQKTVLEQEHVVDEPLNQDELHVERVAINRLIEASEVPSIRQEEDVTVVPILEEVLVTEKRLLLKEEVRITRVHRQVRQPQRVLLRTEQVSVEHFDETDASMKAGPRSSRLSRAGSLPVDTNQ